MHVKTFALLVVSHVLGDVAIASYALAIRKRNAGILPQALAIGFHAAVHAVLAGSLLFSFGGPWWQAALLILAIHFLIDFTRCRVEITLYGAGRLYVKRSELFAWVGGKAADRGKMNLKNLWPWLLIHSLDQLGHLLSLVGISLIG
ncbi:MAG TPA: DUF3307 domain-containing protein [Syntrophobacteria bacterium]|nr:DUF3307 domain-containing protein [Syntrophobacteria bacterium]